MKRIIPVPVPVIAHAARHATKSMRPHFIFLIYRAAIIVPVVVSTMPHDHAVFLIDAGVIESSTLFILWVRRVMHVLKHIA